MMKKVFIPITVVLMLLGMTACKEEATYKGPETQEYDNPSSEQPSDTPDNQSGKQH